LLFVRPLTRTTCPCCGQLAYKQVHHQHMPPNTWVNICENGEFRRCLWTCPMGRTTTENLKTNLPTPTEDPEPRPCPKCNHPMTPTDIWCADWECFRHGELEKYMCRNSELNEITRATRNENENKNNSMATHG
jgi:hypothetical protein